jgi:hypothetical protein
VARILHARWRELDPASAAGKMRPFPARSAHAAPSRSLVLTQPHRRSLVVNFLTGAQDLLGHPGWGAGHDCPEATSVGLQQEDSHRSFDRAGWLYGLQGLNPSDEGFALPQYAFSSCYFFTCLHR